MSDSDSDLLTNNNVFTFQNEESLLVSARGPNTNANNITGISFRNNVLSSTMQMPRNFERQRYTESNYDHRSTYYRRETSPMSIMSACDMRQRNFNSSYYTERMSSQRYAFNGRSGSPKSTRSIDSSASVSAADIAMAFQSMNFNKYDLRVIKDAYNKFMKHRVRKRIEKRRNLRRFLKCGRHRPGGDSGEQGSDSSLSSDDRSTRISNYKENMSSCRSTKTDISGFRRTIKESKMYKDCTDNFRHNSTRSMTSGPVSLNSTQTSVSSNRNMIAGTKFSSMRSMPANFNNLQRKLTIPVMPQKERFKSGFLLPSQRFNRSVASSIIPENVENVTHSGMNNLQNGKGTVMNRNKISARNIETDSDQDDIFSEAAVNQKSNNNVQRKRSIDSDDDICIPNRKRTKIASPCKNSIEGGKSTSKKVNLITHDNDKANDFVFAKPTFPVRKSVKEKLISKSAVPLSDTLVQASVIPCENIQNSKPVNHVEQYHEDEPSNSTQNTTDLSMRPSFIKRKLFTQKLDVSEKRNMSTESLNSPQNSIYSAIQKDKHKARKLQQVTTQSCLSRDVQQDESNLIDLIHKIVPLEQMNVTNQTNKTDLQNSKNKTQENEDKWDVTSIISTRKNDEDVSDTYTDEEIFNATIKEIAKDVSKKPSPTKGKTEVTKNISNKPSPIKGKKGVIKGAISKTPSTVTSKKCMILIEKLSDVGNKSVQKCIKSFWDTDFESDAECQPPPKIDNLNLKENHEKEKLDSTESSKFQGFSSMFNSKKTTAASISNASSFLNNTVHGTQKFNSTSLRIRSHRTPKRKKLDQTRDEDAKSALFEPQSKKQKTFQANSCIELSRPESQGKTDIQNKKSGGPVATHSNQDKKKLPKTKEQVPNIDKHHEYTESVKKLTSKKKPKTDQTETKSINNLKETIQSEQDTVNERSNNKHKKTTQNTNYKKQNTLNVEQTKQEINKKATQSKQTANNKKQDLIAKEPQIKNQSNGRNKKEELAQNDTKTKKHTNTVKKSAETKLQNKKQSPETRSTKKTMLKNNSSGNVDTTIEENNNNSYRPVRSCRNSKQNNTLDGSNLALNVTFRTLRSRQIDLSSTLSGNIKNDKEKVTKDVKSRLSNISFSLTAEKNAVTKKAVTKMTNSRLLQTKNSETSDVSFSLIMDESPIPKKTVSAECRVNSKAGKKQNNVTKFTPLKKNAIQSKEIFVFKNKLKPERNRIPNKRYLMC